MNIQKSLLITILLSCCTLVAGHPLYHAEHSLPASDLAGHIEHWSLAGYRPVYLSGFTDEDNLLKYNTIWHTQKSDKVIEWNMQAALTEQELGNSLSEHEQLGMVPVFIDGFSILDESANALVPQFNVIYYKVDDPSSYEYILRYGDNPTEFQAASDELAAQDFSVDIISTYQSEGAVLLASLFTRPSRSNEWTTRQDMTLAQASTAVSSLVMSQGYALEYMSATTTEGGAPKFAALFVKPTGKHTVHALVDLQFEDMVVYFRTWTIQGMIPKVIDAYKKVDGTVRWGLLFAMFEPEANGDVFPETSCFDKLITEFMRNNDVPGANMAVLQNGKIVYSQGYGVRDVPDVGEYSPDSRLMLPYTPIRIGSATKSVTSLAILRLVQEGRLRLSDKVFGEGGLLQSMSDNTKPCCPIVDDRLFDMTVEQIMTHQGGWANCVVGDYSTKPFTVAATLGIEGPADEEDLIYYYLGKPLQYEPGTVCFDLDNAFCHYTNLAYFIVSRIIEEITGKSYDQAVRDLVLTPSGIPENEMYPGSTQLRDIPDYETEYWCPEYSPTVSVYPSVDTIVPYPYGGWNMEATSGAGAWVASSQQLVRLLAKTAPPHCNGTTTDENGDPCLLWQSSVVSLTAKPENCPARDTAWYGLGFFIDSNYSFAEGNAWSHSGGFDCGNAAYMIRTDDSYAWAAATNFAVEADFEPVFWEAIECVDEWPSSFQVKGIEDADDGTSADNSPSETEGRTGDDDKTTSSQGYNMSPKAPTFLLSLLPSFW